MPNPTLPSNVPRPQPVQVPSSSGASAGPTPTLTSINGPRIKTEPGQEQPIQSLPPNYGNNDARERAMAALHEKYGQNASSQIKNNQSQMLPNVQPASNSPRPLLTPEQQREQQAEYQRRQHALAYQQMQQQQQQQREQSRQYNGQTDGAGDWEDYVAQRRLQALETGNEADMTIRDHVNQMNQSMEGGGLLLPASEQPKALNYKKRKLDIGEGSSSIASKTPQIPQMDGIDDDEEDSKANIKDELFDDDDEDAINSDLDDPDDNEIEDENDEGKPTQVILCTYDKVQRVKTKWKCTLRDGVLNSGGKE